MSEVPSWARKGAEHAAKQAASDSQKQGSSGGNFTPEFYLTEKDPEATVRVLDFEEVVVVRTHAIQEKGFWKQVTCPGASKCPLCDADVYRGTRYVVNVIDRRLIKKKSKTYQDQVKVWMMPLAVFNNLAKVNERFNCNEYELAVSRAGRNKTVSYTILPGEEAELSAEDENKKRIDLFDFLEPKSRKELEAFVPDDADSSDDQDDDSGW